MAELVAPIGGYVQGSTTVFGVAFGPGPICTMRDGWRNDAERVMAFKRELRLRGVYTKPTPRDIWYVSTEHTDADVETTLEIAAEAVAAPTGCRFRREARDEREARWLRSADDCRAMASIDDVCAVIDRDGGVIVEDLVSADDAVPGCGTTSDRSSTASAGVRTTSAATAPGGSGRSSPTRATRPTW